MKMTLSVFADPATSENIVHWNESGQCVLGAQAIDPSLCNGDEPLYLYDDSFNGRHACFKVIWQPSTAAQKEGVFSFEEANKFNCAATVPLYYPIGQSYCIQEYPRNEDGTRGRHGDDDKSKCPGYYYEILGKCYQAEMGNSSLLSGATEVSSWHCKYSHVLKFNRNCYYFRAIKKVSPFEQKNILEIFTSEFKQNAQIIYEISRVHSNYCLPRHAIKDSVTLKPNNLGSPQKTELRNKRKGPKSRR